MFFLQIFLLIFLISLFVVTVFLWSHSRVSPVRFVDGYHVIITGGSSGIGFALAQLFHNAGASITLIARDLTRLRKAKQALDGSAGDSDRVYILSLDLCDSYARIEQQLVTHLSRTGGVDALINCAGYAISRSFADTSADDVDSLMKTNYLASVYVTKAVLPYMLQVTQRNGVTIRPQDRRIVFISSMAAQVAVYGFSAYSASKYAVRGFAEALRMELELTGPMVTLAFPPDTDTPGLAKENVGKPAATLEISSAGGLAAPEEVARTIFMDTHMGKFISAFGLEGKALSWSTAGLLPPVSADSFGRRNLLTVSLAALCEVLAAGPLRAFGIVYSLWMRRTVSKHIRKGEK